MKKYFRGMFIGIAIISACQSKSSRVGLSISGSFVNHAQSVYGVADDTISISSVGGNHYLIVRRTGYQAIREGQMLERRYKTERLEGDLDAATRQLLETVTGRVFRFDPDKGTLLLKDAVYQRVN